MGKGGLEGLLPGKGGAEEGAGFASAGRGFEQRGLAVLEGCEQAGHQQLLGAVGGVGELDAHARDPVGVDVLGGFCWFAGIQLVVFIFDIDIHSKINQQFFFFFFFFFFF